MPSVSQHEEETECVRMTEEERNARFKPGSIRRVRLKNFLTYSDVEFCPGPRLNVVIGPNGTGKSTILCAICLGLGGQPPLLGRADDARTFIMHDQEIAEIEIELSPKINAKKTHIIKRVINRNKGSERGKGAGASSFYINGIASTIKNVKNVVESYHIAVDNLCTFLPQDRVGSFSGFDSKMLLQETEKSLSGTKHLYQQHMDLIELERQILSAGSNLSSVRDKLKLLEEDNKRKEREKELIEERKEHEKKFKLLNQKRAWLEFDAIRIQALELKQSKVSIEKQIKEFRATLQPLRDQCEKYQSEIDESRSRSKHLEKASINAQTGHEKGIRKAEFCQDGIDNEMVNLSSNDTLQRQAQQNVKKMEDKVREVEAELNQYPLGEELKATLDQANEEMRKIKIQIKRYKHELNTKQSVLKDKQNRKTQLEHKLYRMKDDRARRNERIFRQFPKLKDAHTWLEQNRKMFRRPIWGPIVCEITTKNTETASYLEQHVNNSIFKAFVVECDEDYNHLYREVRQKLKIPINVIKAPMGKLTDGRRMYSDQKMDTLKKEHGVFGYLDETFTAPDAVLEALRNTSGVNSVLVGTSKTQESIDRHGLLEYLSQSEDNTSKLIPSCIITSHMNKSYKYTNIISRYSKKSSLRVDEINPARMLSPGVPEQQKKAVENELVEIDHELSAIMPSIEKETESYNNMTRRGQEANQRSKDAKKAQEELMGIKSKLANARKRLRDAKNEATKDFDAEKQLIVLRLKSHTSKYISSLESAAENHSQLIQNTCKLAGIKMSEDGILASLQKVKDQLSEREAETSHLETELRVVSSQFKERKNEMKRLKQKADQIAPIKDASGNELPLRTQLEELPETITEIDALLEDVESKINSIHDNPEVMRVYEEQKKEIEKLRDQLEGLNDAEDAQRKRLASSRDPWESALLNMVNKVNVKFSAYMKELKYSGEIILCRGDDTEGEQRKRPQDNEEKESLGNFKNWGVKIRVKFRAKSDLQTLSAQVHSGGERSVSTIMYLMALQDLMVSPFRCVDEINQGLDERNERFVFKRIVLNSTSSTKDSKNHSDHSGQYFLITPKLLPNLTDMEHEDVTVLCIFNGPYNFSHFNDWNVDEFLNSKKRTRDVVDEGNQRRSKSMKRLVLDENLSD